MRRPGLTVTHTILCDETHVAEGLDLAHTAIRQIKDRKYTQALEGYTGEVLLVGINYDKDDKDKLHSCAIEKITYA